MLVEGVQVNANKILMAIPGNFRGYYNYDLIIFVILFANSGDDTGLMW